MSSKFGFELPLLTADYVEKRLQISNFSRLPATAIRVRNELGDDIFNKIARHNPSH